jgi:pimeloyl-ACP methyl ester carboxylesterase
MPREYAAALLYNHSTHFMFMENPDKFNRIVRDFMG